jgi:phosphatidylglycerophosphatase A
MKLSIHRAVASVMGIGFLPVAPGTWASLLGVAIWYAAQTFGHFAWLQWILVLVCLTAGMISIPRIRNTWGDDPSQVVIDELAGIWIACLMLPHKPWVLLAALVFFRFFDILKPLGIRKLEEIDGAPGVLLDDVLAGIYANACVHVLLWMGLFNS